MNPEMESRYEALADFAEWVDRECLFCRAAYSFSTDGERCYHRDVRVGSFLRGETLTFSHVFVRSSSNER